MSSLPAVLRYIVATILFVVAGAALGVMIVWAAAAWSAAPEQFAVYDTCKGEIGDVTYCRSADKRDLLIRCPARLTPPMKAKPGTEEFCRELDQRAPQARITIRGCINPSLSFDASYNVLVACADGRRIPIIRGPYPR